MDDRQAHEPVEICENGKILMFGPRRVGFIEFDPDESLCFYVFLWFVYTHRGGSSPSICELMDVPVPRLWAQRDRKSVWSRSHRLYTTETPSHRTIIGPADLFSPQSWDGICSSDPEARETGLPKPFIDFGAYRWGRGSPGRYQAGSGETGFLTACGKYPVGHSGVKNPEENALMILFRA